MYHIKTLVQTYTYVYTLTFCEKAPDERVAQGCWPQQRVNQARLPPRSVSGITAVSYRTAIYIGHSYGLGALVAPLVATAFVQNGVQWSRFYAVSIGFTATNVISLVLNFWTDEAEMTNVHHIHSTPIEMEPATLAKIDGDHEDPLDQGQRASEHTLGNASPSVITIGRGAKDEAVTGNRTVWIVCFYLLLCLVSLCTCPGLCGQGSW